MKQVKLPPKHKIYLLTISALGILIVFVGLVLLLNIDQLLTFLLLLVLAAVAEIMATHFTVEQSNIAYEVGTAVGLAAVPFYGPAVAAIIVTVSSISFWLYKTRKTPLSSRSWDQLLFNVGMHSLATFFAGTLFLLLAPQETLISVQAFFVWVIAAVVYDQINLWLLIGLLNLMRGEEFEPIAFWTENRWAMVVNISILTAGGFFLSAALASFEWFGILVFFLPILLSSFSFQMYVNKMKVYTNNLEALVEERTRALSDVMREKDAFFAVLTHDMKTPLTSIGLYASMLEKRPEIILKKPHFPSIILQSQRTLIDMVNNIVDIEKLQTTGELSINWEEVDLVPIAESVFEMMAVQAASKNIELRIECEAKSIVMNADPQQIERILQNLLSNAVKYTPKMGTIDLCLMPHEDQIQLTVKDSGYGIPENEIPFIFDRYRRVSEHQKVAIGTGLGLAITKALVEAHQGQIQVESVVDEGSTFTVLLPVTKVTYIDAQPLLDEFDKNCHKSTSHPCNGSTPPLKLINS